MAIDAQRIKDMFEKWDLAAVKQLYADDFEQTEMDDATPPNAPRKRTKQTSSRSSSATRAAAT